MPRKPVTWQILIASLEHRHAKLKRLLECLAPQIIPSVSVLIYRDNLDKPIGIKRQVLLDTATSDYVSFIDDDDLVSPRYVERVAQAMRKRPHYVGWEQVFTLDGVDQGPVFHSLANGLEWRNENGAHYRGIAHTNLIRRDLALLGRFDRVLTGPGEDYAWIMELAATGRVTDEIYINEPLYYVRQEAADNFHTERESLTVHPPPLNFPFVRYVDVSGRGQDR